MIKVVRRDKINESESFDRHITTVTSVLTRLGIRIGDRDPLEVYRQELLDPNKKDKILRMYDEEYRALYGSK